MADAGTGRQFRTPSTDAILESLARDHAAARDRFDQADAASPDGADALFAADALAGAIAAMPATTVEGIKAKATALHRYRRGPLSADDLGWLDDVESRLVTSILSELLALA